MLHTSRAGSGSPLVLIHGTGSEHEIWKPVLARLAERFDVAAFDLPGCGASPPVSGDPTPTAMAAAVAGELDRLGWDDAHVVGHSLGGLVAAELAAAGRARSYVGIAPGGMATRWEFVYARLVLYGAWGLGRALRPLIPALGGSATLRSATMWFSFARPGDLPRDDAVRMASGFADAPGMPGVITCAPRRLPPARVAQITCPTLIVWGARDRLLSPRQARRWTRAVPHARLRMIRGAGHTPMWDDPEATAGAILDFLSAHEPQPNRGNVTIA